MGQPLRAEVEVPSVARDESASLQVRLASPAAYQQAGLDLNPALNQIRFTLDKRDTGAYVVRMSSAAAVNEPYLDILLELTWATGRVLREYTVLLDPPALRTAPDVVAPVATQRLPAPAPAPLPAPAPVAAAPAPMPSPAPAPAARAAAPSGYTVRSGDTLLRIANQFRSEGTSVDQMLVALFRANPSAFVDSNMNRLMAGRRLSVPGAGEAQSISQADAHREVQAQSADFAQYRSRLATAAGAAAAAPATAAAGQGKVTAKVEDKSAPPKGGDQLKIAQEASRAAAAAKAKEEALAKERALKEQQQRE
ncbi:MAG TPA: FimV/HubP family polar landmark protein, partial [Burkholderiaceae bacterium]|nr:FimV/HubP family polar landmark protein [Burkholderiaceae bacterium]